MLTLAGSCAKRRYVRRKQYRTRPIPRTKTSTNRAKNRGPISAANRNQKLIETSCGPIGEMWRELKLPGTTWPLLDDRAALMHPYRDLLADLNARWQAVQFENNEAVGRG